MGFKKLLALRMWNRIARGQRRIEKLMVAKADSLGLCLLTIDMMSVTRDNEKFVIANILPEIRPMVGQLYDYALLYLDLPTAGIAAGYYRLQLAQDRDESFLPMGILAAENGEFVRNVRYHDLDLFAPLVGTKTVPAKRLTVFETFNATQGNYVFGGTHDNGKAFLIRIS